MKTIYSSPDNVETVIAYLTLKNHRKLIPMPKDKREALEQMAIDYDNGQIKSMAIVKTKDFLNTEKNYKLDCTVIPYHVGKEFLRPGIYQIEELKKLIGEKRLQDTIYSDFHLIE